MKAFLPVLFAVGLSIWGSGVQAYSAHGNFVTVTPQDPVEGRLTVKPTSQRAHVVSFGSDFMSSEGPDLFVVLHKEVVPTRYDRENSVMLGRLKGFRGQQSYMIPANVDLTKYKAIVIWCREFNVTFGTAALIPDSMAFRSRR